MGPERRGRGRYGYVRHSRHAPVGSCTCVADVPLYLGALLSRVCVLLEAYTTFR